MPRAVRPGAARHRARVAIGALAVVIMTLAILIGALIAPAVLSPDIDSPGRVDGIVVVAGANDDRYVYARHLAEEGVADSVLVSRPSSGTATVPPYSATLDTQCTTDRVHARDGRRIEVECFRPDVDTTEGETTAATRIAHERGWRSLLVVTYWGHVSRVRLYFEQCFSGDVYVTDTPRPLSKSRKDALLHETGGYAKALVSPAC